MDIMLIYTFLIVNVALTSSLVTKPFSFRDVTDTDENSVRVRDGKNALQKVTTENLDSRDTRALQIFGGHAPLTSDLGSYDLELMNRRKKRGMGFSNFYRSYICNSSSWPRPHSYTGSNSLILTLELILKVTLGTDLETDLGTDLETDLGTELETDLETNFV
ncbi:uncharacterized protein [Mytilus edulis]|uniref:uncharacterized protein n=1 Tax=Mytilus edulis TaxID=6550 RepID=UPI0039F04009